MVKKMYKQMAQSVKLFLGVLCISALCQVQARAEDDLKIDSFYEYDFKTGVENEQTLSIPQNTATELVLEGCAGNDSFGKEQQYIEESAKVSSVKASSAKSYRSQWVKKKGKWYYYNKNGKLLKNGIYKIGGSYYQFDKKGRRTSVKNVDSRGFTTRFSTKTGKMVSRSIPLKVVKISGSDKKGYSLILRSYKAPGAAKKELYTISIAKKNVNTALVDKKGKRVKISKIKKNAVIQVYTSSFGILETSPAGIPDITKMVVLKKA